MTELAETIKYYYTEKKKDLGSAYYEPLKSDDKYFEKAGEICGEMNMDPQAFVYSIFDINPKVSPMDMSKPNIKITLSSYFSKYQITPDTVVNNAMAYLTNVLKNTGQSVEDVLMEEAYPIPAWIRIVLLKDTNLEINKKYYKTAMNEFNDSIKAYCETHNLEWRRIFNEH